MGQFALLYQPIIPIIPIIYATWNPSDAGSGITFSNGNLTVVLATNPTLVRSTIGKSSGKWYWEVTITSVAPTTTAIGIADSTASLAQYSGQNTDSWGIYDGSTGYYLFNNATFGTTYLAYTTGDVLGFALDMGAGTLLMTKNNVAMGSGISGLSGTIYASASVGGTPGTGTFTANFGASPFSGTVPVGYNPGLY